MALYRTPVVFVWLLLMLLGWGCEDSSEASPRMMQWDASGRDALVPAFEAELISITGPESLNCSEDALFEISIRNLGSAIWTEQYRVVTVESRGLRGDEEVALTGLVDTGEEATFQFSWQAPDTPGRRNLTWEMMGPEGYVFALGLGLQTEVRCDPPAFRLREVSWLDEDIRMWERTSELEEIVFRDDNTQLCFAHTRSDDWENLDVEGQAVAANVWVFIYRDDQWYGATWDWLARGDVCKFASAVSSENIRRSPFTIEDEWSPYSGEVLYFMVSGIVRGTESRNVMARSNVRQVIWP